MVGGEGWRKKGKMRLEGPQIILDLAVSRLEIHISGHMREQPLPQEKKRLLDQLERGQGKLAWL